MTYTHETTIFLADDEQDEEIVVEVEYAVDGVYEAASFDSPGWEPALEVVTITVICDEADGGFDEGHILAIDEVVLNEAEILREVMSAAADAEAEARADAWEDDRRW